MSLRVVLYARCVVDRSQDNRRCLNGSGAASSRRDDPDGVRAVDIRAGRPAALPGIIASQVRRRSPASHELLPVRCLQRESRYLIYFSTVNQSINQSEAFVRRHLTKLISGALAPYNNTTIKYNMFAH